jgi:hypothetical protein
MSAGRLKRPVLSSKKRAGRVWRSAEEASDGEQAMSDTKSVAVDNWTLAVGSASMETTILDDDKFVIINRTIENNGDTSETLVSFERGEELDRLIAALQKARDH